MAKLSDPFTKPVLLMVEGFDEVNLFNSLIKHIEKESHIHVHHVQGKTDFPTKVFTIKTSPGFDENVKSFAIIRDSDKGIDDPDRGFSNTEKSIKNALRNAQLPVPSNPIVVENGGGELNVSYFIMPDNGSPGEIEDLMLKYFEKSPEYDCVNQYFLCLSSYISMENQTKHSRARCQAYLASKDEVDFRLGLAAQKGYIDWNDTVFDDIKTFINSL